MKQSFLKELKNLQTFTVGDLQTKIKQDSRNRAGNHPSPHAQLSHTSSDLNIISPFYERTTHKPDCTCKYHKRQRAAAPKIKKVRTEPSQPLPSIRASLPPPEPQETLKKEPAAQMQTLFEDWRALLSADNLKKYYFQYLKTLPSSDKVKRLDKLDCHNLAFEAFLKNNYLVILEGQSKQDKDAAKQKEKDKDKQKDASVRLNKSSQKVLHKVYTEGNIDYEAISDYNAKKVGFSYKDTSKMVETSSLGCGSLKDSSRFKRLGMKSTGKILQFIDEEEVKSRKEDNRRKKAKFMNSRPSFFGLVEDQELLRELCVKLMTENKRVNKEAEVMVKQLVQSDIEMYEKMIGEIEEDLQAGIKLRNLDNEEAGILVKIVLNKIQKQAQMGRGKDQHYQHKYSLIDDLCNRYGWPKDEKAVELKEFWKMRQQKHSSSFSRSSMANPSKNRISRNNIDSKDTKKLIKSKVKIKEEQRMSGFQPEKSPSKVQNSVKFVDPDPGSSDSLIDIPQPQEFKFISSKPLAKMGIFNRKEKKHKNSGFFVEKEMKSNFKGSRKAFGAVLKPTMGKDEGLDHLQEMDDVVIELQTSRTIKDDPLSISEDSRNSSLYLNLKNQVQRHIEINKRFLKRVQHNLIDNQCEKLIIGMGEGIITKKRKIRAIYEALQTKAIKESDYYNDILKYLEIYEDYCDLVIKNRKERKTRVEELNIPAADLATEKKMEEEQMDLCQLLDSLKNERELKFITLNLLTEEEDPKEELILKIPQYVTKVEPRPRQKKQVYGHGSVDSNRSNSSSGIRQKDCGILQKGLGETVTLQCRNNWGQADYEGETHSSIQNSTAQFQNKIIRFRTALKIADRC